ncbi:MAG: ATP-binding protein, partial [candidate division WOR-3 bacterium]
AMPEGGVLNTTGLNVSLPQGNKQGLAAGEYIRIDISDQGRGVPKEVIEKIFDPYFTTKELGSGLGLSISYSIVKRHGGTITVNSSSGKGSIFSIFLPAAKNKGETPRKEMHEKIEPGMGRILVMDDEELVREIAAELLRHLGYQAETVKDGAEAITAYRQARSAGDPVDVVITDLTVPVSSSLSVLIRSKSSGFFLIVLLKTSANSSLVTNSLFMEISFSEVIVIVMFLSVGGSTVVASGRFTCNLEERIITGVKTIRVISIVKLTSASGVIIISASFTFSDVMLLRLIFLSSAEEPILRLLSV